MSFNATPPLAFEPPSCLSVNENLLPSTNKRDWAYNVGMLTAKDRIVFSKASLVDFLKVHSVEVGPNCTELSALPKFAVVGQFKESSSASAPPPDMSSLSVKDTSLEAPRQAPAAPVKASTPASSSSTDQSTATAPIQSQVTRGIVVDRTDASGEAWKPTRRVREPIGGGSAQIGALFGGDDHDDEQALRDAEASVRARRGVATSNSQSSQPEPAPVAQPRQAATKEPESGAQEKWKPTRRVREDVGGGSSQISSLFGGDEDNDALREAEAAVRARRGGVQPAPEEYQPKKYYPSRRVREPGGTGGASSITFD